MKQSKLIMMMLLIIPISLFATANQEEETTTGLNVFTSILPQQFFVDSIGGDRVNSNVLVGPGKSPATYQPTPSQIIKLSKADILFTTGVPFEEAYLHKIIETLDGIKVVDSSAGISRIPISAHEHHDEDDHDMDEDHDDDHDMDEDHDDDHHDMDEDHDDDHHDMDEDHEDGALDPHVWLSPSLAKIQAKNILDTLVVMDPEGETYYTERYNKLIIDLDNLIVELHEILNPIKGKILFVYHPSFGYFAQEFGLKQIAIETGGKEPTPNIIENIIEEAIESNVHIVIVQPEFSKKSATIIADAIKGEVSTLNPLDSDYINNLKKIANAISDAYLK